MAECAELANGRKSLFLRTGRNLSDPTSTLDGMENYRFGEAQSGCEHLPIWVGHVAVTACGECAQVQWFSKTGPIDSAEGMAALFGNYELVGSFDALAAPTPQVLVYQAPSASWRAHLRAFPVRVWLKAGPHLWMSHDGLTLLLAPTNSLVMENLLRNA